MGCSQTNKLPESINIMMNNFYFRSIGLDFIIVKIQELNKSKIIFYDFWMLTKLLGIHDNFNIQEDFWKSSYTAYHETSLDGILLIFFLLCLSEKQGKLEYVKYYMKTHINLSKENDDSLIMNYYEFKKIVNVYFSCVTLIPLKTYIKINKVDVDNNLIVEKAFSEENINRYTEYLIKNYVKKNFYINAGKFFDENIDLISNDELLRNKILKFCNNNIENQCEKKINFSDNDEISVSDTEKNPLTDREKKIKKLKIISSIRCKCCSKKRKKNVNLLK